MSSRGAEERPPGRDPKAPEGIARAPRRALPGGPLRETEVLLRTRRGRRRCAVLCCKACATPSYGVPKVRGQKKTAWMVHKGCYARAPSTSPMGGLVTLKGQMTTSQGCCLCAMMRVLCLEEKTERKLKMHAEMHLMLINVVLSSLGVQGSQAACQGHCDSTLGRRPPAHAAKGVLFLMPSLYFAKNNPRLYSGFFFAIYCPACVCYCTFVTVRGDPLSRGLPRALLMVWFSASGFFLTFFRRYPLPSIGPEPFFCLIFSRCRCRRSVRLAPVAHGRRAGQRPVDR